jgi:hypothetical protein
MIRAGVCGVLALQMLLTDFRALGHLPSTLMHPPGVMEYVSWKVYDRVMTPRGMLALQVALVGCLAAAAAGTATPVSTKLAALLYIFYEGLLRSFGHFNHDEMTAVWFLIILALTPSGDGFSLDSWWRARLTRTGNRAPPLRPPAAYGYPILLMRIVLAWVYVSSALLKLRLGGLGYFDADSFLTLAISNSLGNMHDTQFRLAFHLTEYRTLAVMGLYVAIIWELLFPLAIISRRLRPYLLGVGVVFHIGTLLVVNITFPVQLAMYLVFIDWDRKRSEQGTLPDPGLLASGG